MRWGKRQPQQQEERKSPSSSTFPLFSWISKLKQIATKPKKTAVEPNPSPRSPPPPALPRSASFHDTGVDVSRRLSVGEDARSHLRSSRHNSLGGLDFRPTFHLAEPHRISRRWPKELLDPDFATSDIDGDAPGDRRHSTRRRRRRCSEKSRMHLEQSDPDRRRSFGRKVRPRPKVRVCSPRSVARRKAAAISSEDGEMVEGLEGFAVVKCSCDPQRDFRDSMVEMIWERGIGRPEELERLLACYLSLNSDEHHDVIVKVFRQVWFDLNPDRFVSDQNPSVSSAV